MSSSDSVAITGKGQVITSSKVVGNSEVSVKDFQLISLLGSGAFGKVYLVRKTGPGTDQGRVYALKSLKKATILSKVKGAEHTIAERRILEAVRQCPFLVTLHYAFQTESRLFLVLDYLGGGELFTHLVQRGKFTVDETTFYTAELLISLSALHDLGIIYRDLKLENILLDNEGHVVLTDFGLSRKFYHWEADQRTYSYCGTVEYMAPEVVDKGKGYDFSADWWSLGVLSYELLTGTSPFTLAGHDNSQSTVRKRVLEGKYPPLSHLFSVTTRSFVESLLVKDPRKRLGGKGADEIRGHAFFFRTNWADVFNRKLPPPFKPSIGDDLDVRNFANEFTSQEPSDLFHGGDGSLLPVNVPHKMFHDYSYVAPFHVDETGAEVAPSSSENGSDILKDQYENRIGGPIERLRLLQRFQASEFFAKYKIDFDEEPIGLGSFSTVRRCVNISTRRDCAVKILNRCVRIDAEIQTLTACQGHPGIVKLIEVVHDKHNSYVVCELLKGGELLSQIQHKQSFSELEAKRVFRMVVDAVRFMHENNVTHLDLKPENILFVDSSSNSQCKIVDFGFAHFIRDLNQVEVDRYTLEYAAPEVLASSSYTPMCDLWSLGVILYVMLSGRVPFEAESPEDMADVVQTGSVDLSTEEWNSVSDSAKDLIRRLLVIDQSKRLTMAELVEHEWLALDLSGGQSSSHFLMTPGVLREDNRGETGNRIHRALAAFFKATREHRSKEASQAVAKKKKRFGASSKSSKTEHSNSAVEPVVKVNNRVITKVASETSVAKSKSPILLSLNRSNDSSPMASPTMRLARDNKPIHEEIHPVVSVRSQQNSAVSSPNIRHLQISPRSNATSSPNFSPSEFQNSSTGSKHLQVPSVGPPGSPNRSSRDSSPNRNSPTY